MSETPEPPKPVEAPSPADAPRGGIGGGWKYTPHTIAFFSGMCVMIVELVAGRLIGRHLGSSLYTWTSIIGVVLAGISIGNYIGGRLADRWKPEDFLGWLFLYASMACMTILALNNFFAAEKPFGSMMWPLRVFVTVFIVFMLPALILGMISPATAKMALDRSTSFGRTIGSVYAWNTVGSILGTLATGFFMISALGAKGVVMFVSLGLGLVGLVLGPRRAVHAVWLAVVLAAIYLTGTGVKELLPVANRLGLREAYKEKAWSEEKKDWVWTGGWGEYVFARDSDYQFVKVDESNSDRGKDRRVRVLSLDYLIHGYVDLHDPKHLEYDYELLYAEVAKRYMKDRTTVNAFFLGGGAYTFPRWVQQQWPGSSCDVAEIDPLVLEANHQALGLPRGTPIRTLIGDARNTLDDLPTSARYDLIFGDAFNDLSVPWHLTTYEFSCTLREHLAPGGALLVNVIDDWDYARLLGAYVNTLRTVFKHVAVFTTESMGVKPCRETFVVAASDTPLDFQDCLAGHKTSFPGSVFSNNEMELLDRKSGGRILTDDDAPVENLLEPVVRNRK
ncbi:MAG: fused MFS/spermidine synthase [Planctomycetes bacterium]|nr:fused MFS/spermidine synthase [Planctomycetota bacterium]